MRKTNEDWVKKCMEIRVEGRMTIRIPRKTWLWNVEADIAELEIDREDIYDWKNCRINVMKRKSNPIAKRTDDIIFNEMVKS